jgi:hypothetical protein
VPAAGPADADADAHKVGSGLAAPGLAITIAIGLSTDRPGGGRRARVRQ